MIYKLVNIVPALYSLSIIAVSNCYIDVLHDTILLYLFMEVRSLKFVAMN